MGKNVREGIAVADLAFYAPLLIGVVFVLIRHGFQKQLGWIYLLNFTIIRLAGAVLELLHTHTPSNKSYLEWSLILSSVGLSPLLLASLGLLKRVIDCTSTHIPSTEPNIIISTLSHRFGILRKLSGKATATSRRSRLIQILQIPTTIALILCISGGTDSVSSSSTPSELKSGVKDTKWGIGIFVVIYVILCVLTLFSMTEIRRTIEAERRVLLAVLLALPLIGSRLLWSILCTFKGGRIFNIEDGSAIVQICMADVEEVLVVCLYVAVGLVVGKYNEAEVGRQRGQKSVNYPQVYRPKKARRGMVLWLLGRMLCLLRGGMMAELVKLAKSETLSLSVRS